MNFALWPTASTLQSSKKLEYSEDDKRKRNQRITDFLESKRSPFSNKVEDPLSFVRVLSFSILIHLQHGLRGMIFPSRIKSIPKFKSSQAIALGPWFQDYAFSRPFWTDDTVRLARSKKRRQTVTVNIAPSVHLLQSGNFRAKYQKLSAQPPTSFI